MVTRAEAKALRRSNIVEAARTLIRPGGDLGFSMRMLAEHAGVSIATPYNLFGSKQAILVAVLDEDLANYERELSRVQATGVDALFEAIDLLTEVLGREPEFYRNVLSALSSDGGAELRYMVSGPRYKLWKALLRDATLAGDLRADVDPDALAIVITQSMSSNVQEWSQRALNLQEMNARIRFAMGLTLSALATPASRKRLDAYMRDAESRLQALWRSALETAIRRGTLDDDTRELLADQLQHLNIEVPEPSPREESA